jgi:hypothetical protein
MRASHRGQSRYHQLPLGPISIPDRGSLWEACDAGGVNYYSGGPERPKSKYKEI